MMAFLTREECKTLLQIADNSKDEMIDLILPMVKDDISTYCKTQTFLNGMKPMAAVMVNIIMLSKYNTGKQSESVGSYSYQAAAGKNGYPDHVYSALNKYRTISGKSGSIKLKANDKRGRAHAACCTDDDDHD